MNNKTTTETTTTLSIKPEYYGNNGNSFSSAGIIYCSAIVGFCLINALAILFYKICLLPMLRKSASQHSDDVQSNRGNTNDNISSSINGDGIYVSSVQFTHLNDDANKPPSYQNEIYNYNEFNQQTTTSVVNENDKLPSYDEIKLKNSHVNHGFATESHT